MPASDAGRAVFRTNVTCEIVERNTMYIHDLASGEMGRRQGHATNIQRVFRGHLARKFSKVMARLLDLAITEDLDYEAEDTSTFSMMGGQLLQVAVLNVQEMRLMVEEERRRRHSKKVEETWERRMIGKMYRSAEAFLRKRKGPIVEWYIEYYTRDEAVLRGELAAEEDEEWIAVSAYCEAVRMRFPSVASLASAGEGVADKPPSEFDHIDFSLSDDLIIERYLRTRRKDTPKITPEDSSPAPAPLPMDAQDL